jgi:hypothetical protein
MAEVSSMIRHEKLLWQPCGEPVARGRGPSDPKKVPGSQRASLNKVTTFAAGTRYWRGGLVHRSPHALGFSRRLPGRSTGLLQRTCRE